MKDKYIRKKQIIKHLSHAIYLLDEKAFTRNPNWESDRKYIDNHLFPLAKKVLRLGLSPIIEHVGFGGIAGTQLITQGRIKVIGRYKIDYSKVLEKAVRKIYEEQQKQNTK